MAEVLEVIEATQLFEPLLSAMEREEIVLLERLRLQFPDDLRAHLVASSQRQGERSLRLVASEPSGRIEDTGELAILGKVLGVLCQDLGQNPFELTAIGERMLEHDKE